MGEGPGGGKKMKETLLNSEENIFNIYENVFNISIKHENINFQSSVI